MRRRSQFKAGRPRRLAHKLSAYAAAGVSMFFGGPIGDLQGAIVHVDLGPNGEKIPQFGHTTYGSTILIKGAVGIDFEQDGIAEFDAVFGSNSGDCGPRSDEFFRSTRLYVRGKQTPPTANRIVQSARPLALGELIRTDSAGAAYARLAFRNASDCDGGIFTTSSSGPFLNTRGYLGLVFRGIDNASHAGWADVSVTGSSLRLFGYAYEAEPGKAIRAGAVPEPPSLVLLAAGAAGLAALRRSRA